MKAKITLLAITLLIAGCCTAQMAIITPTTQNITIAWQHSGLDTTGAVENMSHFNVWLRHNLGLVIKIDETPADTLECDVVLPDTTGAYILGISAVDIALNEGGMHWSTDSTAALGGWYLLFDMVAPMAAYGLIRIK